MPGQVIGTQLNLGYPGNYARESNKLIHARIVRPTDTTNVNFGDPVVLNADNTVSRFSSVQTTLAAALTSGTAYTALSVAALPAPIAAGQQIVIGSGSTTQAVVASAAAAAGATSISVVSFVANAGYAIGVAVVASTVLQFLGIAVREVKQASQYPAQGYPYLPGQPCDVLEEGDVTVVCNEGTPTAGGLVYVVTVAGTNSGVGAIVATPTPAGLGAAAVPLPNANWSTGQLDANNVAEIAIRYRNL